MSMKLKQNLKYSHDVLQQPPENISTEHTWK